MGKKKRPVDSGIIPPKQPLNIAEMFEQAQQPQPSVVEWLQTLVDDATAILSPHLIRAVGSMRELATPEYCEAHGLEFKGKFFALEFGDERGAYQLAADSPPVCRDCIDLLNEVRTLRHQLSGPQDSVFMMGVTQRIGRLQERIANFRPYEQLIVTGAKVHGGGAHGIEGAAKTNECYVDNQGIYQQLIDKFQGEGLGYKAAVEKLSDEAEHWLGHPASPRTIEKYTKPLFRKKPGRPRRQPPAK